MSMTEEELNEMRELLSYVKQQKAAKKRGRRSRKAIAAQDDYDNMSLTEFSGHVQATSQECMELGLTSGFAAARAFDRKDYVTGTVKTCEAVVGIVSVVAIVAQLLGAASGQD